MALAVAAVSATGCTMFENLGQTFRYDEAWTEAATKYRSRSMSAKSWHRHKNRYCNQPHMSDFCAGYRQGYEDICRGESGCTPPFPPREYWSWQYQSAEGQKKVSAWFAGYPLGAQAAEQDGAGHWSQVQMSSTLQSQYVTAGVLPKSDHAVYPIMDVKDVPMGGPTPAAIPLGTNGQTPSGSVNGAVTGVMPVPMTAGTSVAPAAPVR